MNERKIPSILLRFDTSNNIISHSELVGTSEEKEHTNTLLNILYDTAINKRSKDYKDYKMFKGLCTKKFNLISSQFSLHYYFKSESRLRGFINKEETSLWRPWVVWGGMCQFRQWRCIFGCHCQIGPKKKIGMMKFFLQIFWRKQELH